MCWLRRAHLRFFFKGSLTEEQQRCVDLGRVCAKRVRENQLALTHKPTRTESPSQWLSATPTLKNQGQDCALGTPFHCENPHDRRYRLHLALRVLSLVDIWSRVNYRKKKVCLSSVRFTRNPIRHQCQMRFVTRAACPVNV